MKKVHDYKHIHVGTHCFVYALLRGILLNYRFRAAANRLLMPTNQTKPSLRAFCSAKWWNLLMWMFVLRKKKDGALLVPIPKHTLKF